MDISALSQRGYLLQKGFLPRETVEILSTEAHSLSEKGLFRSASIGKGAEAHRDSSIRNDKIHWINSEFPSQMQQLILNPLEKIRVQCNEQLFMGLESFEGHYAHYETNSFYVRHRDAFRDDDSRRLSVICYLNSDWQAADAGEIVLHLPSGPLKIAPEGGTLLLFLSREIEHEVLPTRSPRWSFAGWFKNRPRPLV